MKDIQRWGRGPRNPKSSITFSVVFRVLSACLCALCVKPLKTANLIAEQRLLNQCIIRPQATKPADVVAWLGAVQAQEYPFAKWALSLRMQDETPDAEIERALDEGRILRTHVMRPTWHFVTPPDIRWMLELTASRVHRTLAIYNRRQGLTPDVMKRGTRIFERALRNGRSLTRRELGIRLERAGIAVKGVPLALLTVYAELEGVICSGPRQGGQLTYALLAERAPRPRIFSRDESLAELTLRYFRSHGPATIRDFVWWSGLLTADVKRGLEINEARQEVVNGRTYWTVGHHTSGVTRSTGVHLLPIYDEYTVAYRDRDAVPHATAKMTSSSGQPVMFQHALVIDGKVAGTWRTARKKAGLAIDVIPLRRLNRTERLAIAEAAQRYQRFLGAPVFLEVKREN